MKKLSGYLSILAAAAILPSFADAGAKGIYGKDDRLDYYAAGPAMRQLADSVASLWESPQVKFENGAYKLATLTFATAANLCPGERFGSQPMGAFCSGALVGEDIVLTAGHCITDEARCAGTKFVFGFNIPGEGGVARTTVGADEVYGCRRIIKRDLDKQPEGLFGTGLAILGHLLNRAGPDYALVQLDRRVEGRRPLPVSRDRDLKEGDSVFVIGHPVGLPVKIAGGAGVRNARPRAFYLTDLDTFGGNSGSAVFNARTNRIEGILVRGGQDFADTPAGCRAYFRAAQNEGRGEAVTKISALREFIPEIEPYKAAGPEARGLGVGQVSLDNRDLAGRIRF